ncbi:hypothetical protein IMZ31_23815 (plasmid) [Pontibacillus sp. ALD_SL1]|uniref:LamG-like jellyroll fold domain-containing protein n=1 Tax=Pontibacillus sp. ALD_SL1 TaxID=2777185 RepID=UPI001A95B621|nr:hypothetical protein [Pontibacillus sp. ALD_SL1]QST02480.1 hypothetical protein IMZ31_23815 [Pontibacillus sp. ALD_SL1]
MKRLWIFAVGTVFLLALSGCLPFDNDEYAVLPHSPLINKDGPFLEKTVEIGFRFGSGTSSTSVLYEEGDETVGFSIYIRDTTLYATAYSLLSDGSHTPWGPVTVSAPVPINGDIRLSLTMSALTSDMNLYIDGTLADSTSGIGPFPEHDHGVLAAALNGTRIDTGPFYGNRFTGLYIAEMRYWNTVRAQPEIASYQNKFDLSGDEEGLVGLWNFDDTTTFRVYDQTDNGHDLLVYHSPEHYQLGLSEANGTENNGVITFEPIFFPQSMEMDDSGAFVLFRDGLETYRGSAPSFPKEAPITAPDRILFDLILTSSYGISRPVTRPFDASTIPYIQKEAFNFSATANETSVVLFWEWPDSDEYSEFKALHVYRDGDYIGEFPLPNTSLYYDTKDTNLIPSTTYTYTFVSENTDGTLSPPTSIDVTTWDADYSVTPPAVNPPDAPVLDVPSGITFPEVTYSYGNPATASFASPISITLPSATDFTLSVSAEPFRETGGLGYSFPSSSLTLTPPLFTSGPLAPVIPTDSIPVDDGGTHTIASLTGGDTGTYILTFPPDALSLTIPFDRPLVDHIHYDGVPTPYTTTLNWELSAGP